MSRQGERIKINTTIVSDFVSKSETKRSLCLCAVDSAMIFGANDPSGRIEFQRESPGPVKRTTGEFREKIVPEKPTKETTGKLAKSRLSLTPQWMTHELYEEYLPAIRSPRTSSISRSRPPFEGQSCVVLCRMYYWSTSCQGPRSGILSMQLDQGAFG